MSSILVFNYLCPLDYVGLVGLISFLSISYGLMGPLLGYSWCISHIFELFIFVITLAEFIGYFYFYTRYYCLSLHTNIILMPLLHLRLVD